TASVPRSPARVASIGARAFAASPGSSTLTSSGALMSARTRRYPTGDELMATAMQKSGLADFGPGDFRDGLDNLLASLERDGDLDPAADSRVIDDFLRRLGNRREVEAWYRSHPEIEQHPISQPVRIYPLP